MKRIIEIKSAEGGKDSKLFVHDLCCAYKKMFERFGWKFATLEESEGNVVIEVTGKGVDRLNKENGGHRIQRIPPTETRGRVHTSTVVVSVSEKRINRDIHLNERALSYSWFSGSGAGGQHRNKHQNCLRLTHKPSGITVSKQGRKREFNIRECKAEMVERLKANEDKKNQAEMATRKQANFGSGMRGDKTFTIRFQDNIAVCHSSGKRMSCKKYMRGYMSEIW